MGTVRFLLALSVALWHVPGHAFTLVYAAPAVIGFFIVSGFYMAMVLTEKYRDARSFYVARFWRLYPAYAAMAIVMVLWHTATGFPTVFTSLPRNISLLEQAVVAALNVAVAGQDVFEFARQTVGDGPFLYQGSMLVGQAWSLSSELFFYCLAPFVVRCPRRTAALLAVALMVRWGLLGILDLPWVWGYFFFPGSVCMFLMGALGFHVLANVKPPPWLAPSIAAGWIAVVLSTVASKGIFLGGGSIDTPQCWLAYIAFALSIPVIFRWSKDNRIDRAIGDLSYPLYLVHGLVQGIVIAKLGAFLILAVSASVIAAIAMRQIIEVPVERWRSRRMILQPA